MNFCSVLGTHPSDTPGGAELQAQLICSELNRRGHNTVYVAYNSDCEQVSEHNGVVTYRLDTNGRYGSIKQLLSTIRKIKPDVIYLRNIKDLPLAGLFKTVTDTYVTFNISHDAQCLPRFAHWPGKTDPTLVHAIYRRTKLAVRRSFLTVPDTLFIQTKTQQRLLKKHRGLTGILTGNGHPIPEGEPEKHSPPVVLWLASIKEWKQPLTFVDVAEACQDLDCEFWLVGRPSDATLADEIRDRTKRLPNLEYYGGCTIEESNDYLEQASVFVNTSKQEGFPNTFIQAWLRKTPVVSLNVNPLGETPTHETGYYGVEQQTQLTNRVRDLIKNPDHRRTLADQAYAYACEHNDIKTVVDRIENALPDQVVS